MTKLQSYEILNLLLPSDEFELQPLVTHIQEICYKPDYLLFKSTKFRTLIPSILEIILKQDYFNIYKEIIIWEKLLKWACEQQPAIQQDINKWNKNDFTVMERRLSRFISLVRFYHISSEDFLLKVYPYKEILPNDLVNNIFANHMAPNNKPSSINMQLPRYPCSTIINHQHLNIFASWIDKKEILHDNKVGHIPYRFKLIYHASRDSNT